MNSMGEGMAEQMERLKELIKERALLYSEEGFTLASGKRSHYYFDLKPILLDAEGLNLIAECMYEHIKGCNAEYIGGLESGAIPIVAAICMLSWKKGRPLRGFYVRKERKPRGTMKTIEGNLESGAKVVIVEDVTTTGSSVLKAIEEVQKKGCTVVKVISVIEREEGAREKLEGIGVEHSALFVKSDFVGKNEKR